MMARLASLLLACGLIASAYGSRKAETHYLTNMPEAGQVVTSSLFPRHANKQFPAGKMAEVVLGIRNEGSDSYNLTMIAGSLNSPVDFAVHVQNFTQMGYGEVLAPGEERSFEYKFFPDPRLEPRDFVVALTAFYSDDKGKWYSSTFFNETVNIVEIKKMVDWELLFLILLFAAGTAGIGYVVYSYLVSQGLMKAQKKRSRPRTTAADGSAAPMSAADQQDWLKGTPYQEFANRRDKSVSSRRTPKAT